MSVLNPNQFVDIYHRTDPESAGKIIQSRRIGGPEAKNRYGFAAKQDEVYGTDTPSPDSNASGFGRSVVHLRVRRKNLMLDDQFYDKDRNPVETHYFALPEDVKVVRAWTDLNR